MDPTTIALAIGATAQAINALLEVWRRHTGKPEGWKPTNADWLELEAWARKTPEDIKREARERLGVK